MSVLKFRLFVLLFVAAGLSNIYAQDIEVEIGESFKARSKYSFVDFIHGDENNFYSYSYKGVTLFKGNPVLHKFDNNYNEIYAKEILSPFESSYSYGFKYAANGFIHWLLGEHDKKNKTIHFHIATFNLDGENVDIKKVGTLENFRVLQKPDINWKESEDKTKFAIVTASNNSRKKDGFASLVAVYDQDLNIFNEITLDLDHDSKLTEVTDFLISNNGDLYLAVRMNRNSLNYREDLYKFPQTKVVNQDTKVFYIPNGQKNVTEFGIIKKKGQEVKNIVFKQSKDNNIYISGTYGMLNDAISTGIFINKYGKNNQLEFSKTHSIPQNFLVNVSKNVLGTSKDKIQGFNNFLRTNGLEIMNDGSVYLIAENRSTKSTTVRNGGTYYEFITEEKFITYFDNEGKIKNSFVVPQSIKHQSIRTQSYFAYNTGEKLYLILNDLKDNIESNKPAASNYKVAKNMKNMASALIEFNPDKKHSFYRTIFGHRKLGNMLVIPMLMKNIQENEILFIAIEPYEELVSFAFSSDKLKYGRIKVK